MNAIPALDRPAHRIPLRTAAVALAAALALLLGACSEREQTADRAARKIDAPSWSGVVAGAPGQTPLPYKAGDQASWEAHLKARTQGQNEYSRPPSLR
ncbi:MAG: hypothetical protein AMXMBFR78_02760 [Rubrivivax sp.]|jgi:hypothetical protein